MLRRGVLLVQTLCTVQGLYLHGRIRPRVNRVTMSAMASKGLDKLTTIVWLREELRLKDNALLDHAQRRGGDVLPVFCFDDKVYSADAVSNYGPGKCGARRAQFVIESVADLKQNLGKLNRPLVIRRGSAADALKEVQKQLTASGRKVEIVCSASVCHEEQKSEVLVETALSQKLVRVWDATLYHRDEACLPVEELFTNWRTKVEKKRTPIRPELQSLKKLGAAVHQVDEGSLPSLAELGYHAEDALPDLRGDFFNPKGGETAALARLKQYVWDEDRLKDYFDTRNGMIGQGYSTKLAPWLARGCVSARTVARECSRYEQKTGIKNKSTYWVVFELTWRDYFIFYSQKVGRKLFMYGGVIDKAWPTSNKDAVALKKWQDGMTGEPLVDANMRELKSTGFMSNRGRQNVASYLIHDLGVDWRLGAAWFEQELVDFTPEANWGNWHAAAGLQGGRVNKFNILKQSKDYDAQGAYVKLWCPELQNVPAPNCFEPHKLNSADKQRYGSAAYPPPLGKATFVGASRQAAAPSRGGGGAPRGGAAPAAQGGNGSWGKLGPGKSKEQAERDKKRKSKANVQAAWNTD
ncbi:DNA photolyase, FAD-binding/Cryptochrome [Pelagophyceae sp. CCMP2097]|nr:DNA photolyase, FAD-binding/Cryptochrome [Pelagophyceae sp. CCMP2097]